MTTVLYICPDISLGGSTRSLNDLIMSLKDEVKPIVLLPRSGPALELFKSEGVECIVFPYTLLHQVKRTGWKRCILHPWRIAIIRHLRQDWNCALNVKKILGEREIDIVHSNFSPATVGCILSRILKAKHVWHIREFLDLHFHFDIFLGIPRLRRLINHADARIFISQKVCEHWMPKKKNTWIINDAVCSGDNLPSISWVKQPYFMFCSFKLTEAKGARIAIEAFGRSRLNKDGYSLKMVGNCDPDYRESLLKTADTFNCADRIDFLPCQDDLSSLYANAAGFIMSSYCEGLGRVTAEAMFYGCPVIAHASGGTLDLVQEGITGHLFTTVNECASKMRLVCSSSQKEIIEKAQSFIIENLSQKVYGPKVLEVYRTVLSS